MTKSRRRQQAVRDMTFDEKVLTASKEPTYAKSNKLFVHPVRTNRTTRAIGHFPSQVMEAMLPFHSEPERVLLNLLDLTIGVSKFLPQPETFEWSDGKNKRRYTPDCGVFALDRRIMVEAKLEADANTPENVEIRELSAPFLAADGWELVLVTDATLFHPDLLRNIRTIRRRRAHPYHVTAIRKLQQLLQDQDVMTFADCAAVVTSMGGDADLIYAAIGRRELYCNLWKPLTERSNLIHPKRAPRPFLFELFGEV